mmetsp:Transcript_11159/g.19711  ORF Transcript_11159/g.19711 Transcript_11159/m.19711 type:complete len:204 (+) Transcript_11159:2356-2967(+)
MQPRMGQRLVGCVSAQRVHHQQFTNQVLGLVGDGGPILGVELKRSAADLAVQVLLVAVVERRIPSEQNEQDHAKGPHVHGRAVQLVLQNFRSNVAGCAALLGEGHSSDMGRKSEIHDFHIRIVLRTDHEQVFRLEISVSNVAIVTVLDAMQQYLHQITRLFFVVVGLLDDAVKELATINLFQHKVKHLWLLKEIIASDDVWVI